ncbi:trypsin-like serine peptidase [Mucilaginibacter glaciei]|uniref:Trypsin-like peptidase domain-containing protein n=1 Tax=Mucilaginibacter glaciei TaxID=2772109 RepID=A0A926S3T4_9SPHI|nr:serine protease [Mucilaginibacter glaciei]MBD1395247.1 trypsin-like peptidase domain-containing protein [Mucilaginibacter glaciei]
MLNIIDIIKGIRCTRAEFAKLFADAQAMAERKEIIAFEAIAPSAYDGAAIHEGLSYSKERGFLAQLTELIVSNQLEDGSLANALIQIATANEPEDTGLQAMSRIAAGLDAPLEFTRGMVKGMRITAKILIDGDAAGTGILVSPDAILTSWHVVEPLFESDGQLYQPAANTAERLSVEFDNFLNLINLKSKYAKSKIAIDAHEQWCIGFSVCHQEELLQKLPQDLSQLNGHWDYALIRLSKAPGFERDWETIEYPNPVPAPDGKIILFQHPAGQSLKMDQRLITTPDPDYPNIVPSFRFVHSANTVSGSSGGPCFNKDFKLFGIHQGCWSNRNGNILNRGVPLLRITEHMAENQIYLPEVDAGGRPVWRISGASEFTPVVGCDDFKSAVWACVQNEPKKIILVSGVQGSGKTFRLAVLAAILPQSSHLILNLSAAIISKMSASELAQHICEAAGGVFSPNVTEEGVSSTSSIWIKTVLIPDIIASLEASRGERLVWIGIADLNSYSIEDGSASELLFGLYERALSEDWLRFVLDDMQINLPQSLRDTILPCRVSEITKEEIQDFFLRYNRALPSGLDDSAISVAASSVYVQYKRAVSNNPEKGGTILADEVILMIKEVLSDSFKKASNG